MDSTVSFGHQRLVVYQRARQLVASAAALIRGLPREEAALRDQLRRAGDSVLLNICEGAGRSAPRDKARFYDMARASGTECAAALEIAAIRALAPATEIARARSLLCEVVCMLTAMARNARRGATR